MCGRFTRSSPREVICEEFHAVPSGTIDFAPRYNICPGEAVLAVVGAGAAPHLGMLRWGLVPFFAQDPSGGPRAINARAETLAARPTFREAFRHRRCLVVADGFYEWRREGRVRTPYFVRPVAGRPIAFAGLWDRWRAPEGGVLATCAIVTCPANERLAAIHERMPVIVAAADRGRWLDPRADPARLPALLRPCPSEALDAYEVSRLVNSPRNDAPECARPIA
jgi:putative SOS response-associated peptidase YedK